jgi:H+-transporting ATPase
MLGFLCFMDPPRPDTAHVIAMAESFGVEVKMITGDERNIAIEMCKTIGLPKKEDMERINAEQGEGTSPNILPGTDLEQLPVENLMEGKLDDGTRDFSKKKDQDDHYWQTCNDIHTKYGELCENSNGFAGVLPEHKFLIVEALRQQGHMVGMCGDGVNDAPALARADVGIAVSGATEAAQASADIVLTDPGLSTIVTAMVVSRKIFTRMKNFVIYRVACTEQLLFFFLISCLAFNPRDYAPKGYNPDDWPEYFSLPVIALVTICILNDGTIISVAYDNVEASLKPEAWDLKIMYWVASVIGMVALASSILLLDLGLKSAKGGNNGLCALGVDKMTFPEIQTMMYLKISLSDYCSVFNSRTKGWCWSRPPSPVVMAAALLAVTAATIFSAYWPFGSGMKGMDWGVIAIVWVYVLLWSLVQDACKVFNNYCMAKLGLVQNLGVVNEENLNFNKSMARDVDSGADNFGPAVEISRSRATSVRKSVDNLSEPVHGLYANPSDSKPTRWFSGQSSDPTIRTLPEKSSWADEVDDERAARDRSISQHEEPITHQLVNP